MKNIIPLITLSLGLSAFAAAAQEETETPQHGDGPPRWRAQQFDPDAERPARGPWARNADTEETSDQARPLRRQGNRPEARAQRPGAGRRAMGNQGTERPGPRFNSRGQGRGQGLGPRAQAQRPGRGQGQAGICPECGCPGPRAHLRSQRSGTGRQQPGWNRQGGGRGYGGPGFGPNAQQRGRGMGPMMRGPRGPRAEQDGTEAEPNGPGYRGRGQGFGPPAWRQ